MSMRENKGKTHSSEETKKLMLDAEYKTGICDTIEEFALKFKNYPSCVRYFSVMYELNGKSSFMYTEIKPDPFFIMITPESDIFCYSFDNGKFEKKDIN